MAAATFAMAVASGLQAALYLHSFGIDGRTDGFFVAFALYSVFGVFSQSIRVTSAPLLVDAARGLRPREFGATLVLIAVPVAILTMPLAHPLATGPRPRSQRRRPQRHPGRPADPRPGDGPAALGGRRRHAARRPRPLQHGRRRLHRRRRVRPGRLPRRLQQRRRALARLLDAGDGGRDLRSDALRAAWQRRSQRGPAGTAPPGRAASAEHGQPDPRPHLHLPRLQRALPDHACLHHRLRARRRDRPLLRLPLRQLPRRRHRLRTRHVAHRRYEPEPAHRHARGPDRNRAAGAFATRS